MRARTIVNSNISVSICRKCVVAGRVQGVAFRAHTQREALRRNITGHAKNLPDGTVEVLACGAEPAVNALCDWLRHGPPLAQVSDVRCAAVQFQAVDGFLTM